ncbi:ribonuclease p subunit p30 [Holotrichia oblita]|uniref:Ribonuclease p subunit p30 n=2 Tax=Holotrichia oblita TaxID=644536 RepID=A0ACB9TBP9_HOLOL|nr:ribonuclease p subunit p30 [Holotrichia oblita]KAI4464275.1 ribonuclease p subunit p30 [Holotrichia oblita]
MEVVKGYFDYCISEQCLTSEDFTKTKKLLIELGYRTIAINQILEEANLEPKKKKKKGEPRDVIDIVPAPIDVTKYETKSPNYKKYHIIAILPLTQNAVQFACSNIDADILSYDPENKIPYKLTRKMYNQLIEKGFHYEILYAPAIQDSTQRKNMIQTSHIYHSFGKSKNVIISSGATSRMLLRGPYDIINLGIIFGLSEEQAKNSILHCARNVYLNAIGRSRGKTIMFVENICENSDESNRNVTKEVDLLLEEDDEEMELEQPAQKKTKQ